MKFTKNLLNHLSIRVLLLSLAAIGLSAYVAQAHPYAGNILGTQQSGHIATVGYELYCELLEQAVRTLKQLPAKVSVEVSVDLPTEAVSQQRSPRRLHQPTERLHGRSVRRPDGVHHGPRPASVVTGTPAVRRR